MLVAEKAGRRERERAVETVSMLVCASGTRRGGGGVVTSKNS